MSIEDVYSAQMKAYELEEAFDWRKWSKEIPCLQFPAHWQVKIIPPFAAAMIRFLVRLDGMNGWVSVYLDCYDTLGCCEQPYWEIYPSTDGEPARFLMKETDRLLNGIERSLQAMQSRD